MMNVVVAASECSSGCESGWTLYLEHSSSNTKFSVGYNKESLGKEMAAFEEKDGWFVEQEDEEEDLSMVSDASSGPPHFENDVDEEENEEDLSYNSGRSKKRRNQCCSSKVDDDFVLDDTASSPVFTYKNDVGVRVKNINQGSSLERLIDYSSQGFSATHRQGRSTSSHERHRHIQSPCSTKRYHRQNQ